MNEVCEDCLRPLATKEQWANEHGDGNGCECAECVSVCWGDKFYCAKVKAERERKRCSQCNMPDVDGALYVMPDDDNALWCGGCLRKEVTRLWREEDRRDPYEGMGEDT